jgi:hypothetical protein
MIPLGSITNAGAAADAFDVAMATIVLGTMSIALIANLGAVLAWVRSRWRNELTRLCHIVTQCRHGSPTNW